MALLIGDEGFNDCGLVKAFGKDGVTEYVLPDVEPLFEELGSKCFEMPIEEMEKEKARLAARAREGQGDTAKRGSGNGDDLERKSEIAVPVAPSTGSPKEEKAEQQEEGGTKPLSLTSADSEAIARSLEDMNSGLTKLEVLRPTDSRKKEMAESQEELETKQLSSTSADSAAIARLVEDRISLKLEGSLKKEIHYAAERKL